MPISPISSTNLVQRYTNINGPANLVILSPKKLSGFGPESVLGSGSLPSKILPYSGIYDENGKLPKINGNGASFLAKV